MMCYFTIRYKYLTRTVKGAVSRHGRGYVLGSRRTVAHSSVRHLVGPYLENGDVGRTVSVVSMNTNGVAYRLIKIQHIVTLMVVADLDHPHSLTAAKQFDIIILYELSRDAVSLLCLSVGGHGYADGIAKIGFKGQTKLGECFFTVKCHAQRFAPLTDAVRDPRMALLAQSAGEAVCHLVGFTARFM